MNFKLMDLENIAKIAASGAVISSSLFAIGASYAFLKDEGVISRMKSRIRIAIGLPPYTNKNPEKDVGQYYFGFMKKYI